MPLDGSRSPAHTSTTGMPSWYTHNAPPPAANADFRASAIDRFESSIDHEPVTVRLAQRLVCHLSPRRQNRRSAQRSTALDSVSPAILSRPRDTHCSLFTTFGRLMGMNREQLDQLSFDVLPEQHREPARAALLTAADGSARASLEPVSGGASGALVHRVDIEGAPQPAPADRDGARSVPQPASQLRVPAHRRRCRHRAGGARGRPGRRHRGHGLHPSATDHRAPRRAGRRAARARRTRRAAAGDRRRSRRCSTTSPRCSVRCWR